MTITGKVKIGILCVGIFNTLIIGELIGLSPLINIPFGILSPFFIISILLIMHSSAWKKIKQPKWNDSFVMFTLDRSFLLSDFYFGAILMFGISLSTFTNSIIHSNQNWKTAIFFLSLSLGIYLSVLIWSKKILNHQKGINKGVMGSKFKKSDYLDQIIDEKEYEITDKDF